MNHKFTLREERWIECEEIYKSNRQDSANETDNDSSSDYYNLFVEPDPYQMFYFTLHHSNHEEYRFERHLDNSPLHRNLESNTESHKDIVLRGIKAENGQVISSTGLTLWRASSILCNFLCRHYKTCIEKKSILELGAGIGLCGIVCYSMGKCNRVVMTDGDTDVLESMRYNVQINIRPPEICNTITSLETDMDELLPCRQLIWGQDQQLQDFKSYWGTFDVIIGSDIIYQEAIIDPLFQTVRDLLTPSSVQQGDLHNPATLEVILSSQSVFLLAYARRNVKIDLVLDSAMRHGLQYRIPETDEGVFVFYRKFET